MSASVIKCEEFLRNEITRVEEIPNKLRRSGHYLRRNTLLYSWLLQRKDGIARRNDLARLVGESLAIPMNVVIDLDFIYHYSDRITSDFIILSENMMNAIEKVFDDPSFNYLITKPIPYFKDGTTGEQLINYLNLIDGPRGQTVIDLILTAFSSAFEGIRWESISPTLPNFALVSEITGKWQFLFCIYSYDGAVSERDADRLIIQIYDIRERLRKNGQELEGNQPIDVLIFAPSIDNVEVEFVHNIPRIYYAWSLSVLRFFHLLHGHINKENKLAATCLPAIFLGQDGLAFSSNKAVVELSKAIDEKKK